MDRGRLRAQLPHPARHGRAGRHPARGDPRPWLAGLAAAGRAGPHPLHPPVDDLGGGAGTGDHRRSGGPQAEASRSAGWTAYDSGKAAAAERHYSTALRAAASADDHVVAANTLAFWAIQHYSTGDPRGAVDLVEAALSQAPTTGSARMTSMLHARACRAHARAGDTRAADRSANAALTPTSTPLPSRAISRACTGATSVRPTSSSGAPPSIWATPSGPSSTSWKPPPSTPARRRTTATPSPRGHAIYLARLAEAHLGLGDVDAAVATAHDAVDRMGGVTSARGTSTLEDLRKKLARRRGIPAVAEFLDYTDTE